LKCFLLISIRFSFKFHYIRVQDISSCCVPFTPDKKFHLLKKSFSIVHTPPFLLPESPIENAISVC